MTGREAERLEETAVKVLTPEWSGTHWLAQVTAYLEVSGILGVQLVPGVDEGIQVKLGLAKGGDKTMIRLRMLESNYRSLKKR